MTREPMLSHEDELYREIDLLGLASQKVPASLAGNNTYNAKTEWIKLFKDHFERFHPGIEDMSSLEKMGCPTREELTEYAKPDFRVPADPFAGLPLRSGAKEAPIPSRPHSDEGVDLYVVQFVTLAAAEGTVVAGCTFGGHHSLRRRSFQNCRGQDPRRSGF